MEKEKLIKLFAIIITIVGSVILIVLMYTDKAEKKVVQYQAAQEEKKLQSSQYAKIESLEKQDTTWQRKLKEKTYGNTDLLLLSDGIDQSLYTTIYPWMNGISARGTFILKNGIVPGERPEDISRDEFNELLTAGWNYAYSVDLPEDKQLEGWKSTLDAAIAHWNEAGIWQPDVYVCGIGQYVEGMEEALQERGFHFLLLDKNNDADLAETFDAGWQTMDALVLSKNNNPSEAYMDKMLNDKQSLCISIGRVMEQAEHPESDMSLKDFEDLMENMQKLQEKQVQILSYQEYIADRNAANEELSSMQEEYQIFQKKKEKKVKELTKKLDLD